MELNLKITNKEEEIEDEKLVNLILDILQNENTDKAIGDVKLSTLEKLANKLNNNNELSITLIEVCCNFIDCLLQTPKKEKEN